MSDKAASHMITEIRETPEVIRRQQHGLAAPIRELCAVLARRPPRVAVTCARGSSAHAATFGKHLIERHIGIPVAPMAPNIATVYRRHLRLEDELFLAVSQSGSSDDLVECALMAKGAGACTAAIVNNTASPLAKACDIVLPMNAGAELSVAATKSFVAAVGVLLRLLAAWTGDAALQAAIERLPERLALATAADWTAALPALAAAGSLVTLGRGPTLAIAREAALKLKETCRLHAEAFSGAEFLHGPVALAAERYPILIFMPNDEAAASLRDLVVHLIGKSEAVFVAEPGDPRPGRLPAPAPDHPDTDALCLIQSFYALAVALAKLRGTNVDRPPHLQKITRTR